MGYKLKRILIYPDGVTEKQVYPVLEYDFTKSDYGFTYKQQSGSGASYGRDSNGLYAYNGGNDAVAFKIPSDVYSKGHIRKCIITANNASNHNGVGLTYGADTKVFRHLGALRVIWGSQNNAGTNEEVPVNTDRNLIIDLEHKLMSTSFSQNTLALTDNAISTFNTDRDAGNVNLTIITYNNNRGNIKKVRFYF